MANNIFDIHLKFIKIKSWAYNHINILMRESNNIVNKICDRAGINNIKNDPSQKWSSKEEMKNAYINCMNKYMKIFYGSCKFNMFEPPHIYLFDNPMLVGGYYYQNNFYLNVSDWKNSCKYEVENLVLHETIPGHHLQIDYMMNSPNTSWFAYNHCCFNGFIEGWGLFAENYGVDDPTLANLQENTNETELDSLWKRYGYLQMNILRTFRIIAEILLHVDGASVKNVISLAKQYLTMSDSAIEAEIYRYRIIPGQACSYKIGYEIIKQLIESKYNIDINNKNIIYEEKPINFIKYMLWNDVLPLDLFMEKYDMKFKF
jgi:hypothetical protein